LQNLRLLFYLFRHSDLSVFAEAFLRLFLELFERASITGRNQFKRVRKVYEVVGIDHGAPIRLTVPIHGRSLNELFVEEHDDLLLSFAYDSATSAEWKVLPQNRARIHDSVANAEV
jgi:hypothetical protein